MAHFVGKVEEICATYISDSITAVVVEWIIIY